MWNRPPARIYLGDAGSYLLGTALAMLLAAAFDEGDSLAVGSGAALFVAVPVADTAVAVVRRLRAGRALFRGDRGHVYDQLIDKGWGSVHVVVVCIAVQALLVGIGVAIGNLPAGSRGRRHGGAGSNGRDALPRCVYDARDMENALTAQAHA